MKFQEIEPNYYRLPAGRHGARLADVREGSGLYGRYLRFIFTIADGDLMGYRFSGFVTPSFLKHDTLYRWVKTILGAPPSEFSPKILIGRECFVFLSKKNDRFYSVTNVRSLSEPV